MYIDEPFFSFQTKTINIGGSETDAYDVQVEAKIGSGERKFWATGTVNIYGISNIIDHWIEPIVCNYQSVFVC